MKKIRIFLVLLFHVVSAVGFLSEVQAGVSAPTHKFARGIAHIVTAPFQAPKEIIQTTVDARPFYVAPWKGVTVGVGKGAYSTGRQLVSGLFDLFTFFTPGGPLFEPETYFPQI